MQDQLPDPEEPIRGSATQPHFVVRRAGLDEYSTIRHVQALAIRSLGDKLLDAAEIARAISTIYSADHLMQLMGKTVLVAELNDAIVGTCAWGPSDDRGTSARLTALFVHPLSQGQGVGRSLIAGTEADAALGGFARFSVSAPVALVPLFTSSGYTIASHGTSHDVIPDVSIQVAFLRKPG